MDFPAKTHLRILELLPELVADFTFLEAPDQYSIYLVGAMGVGPAAQVAAGVLEIGPTAKHMTAHL